MLESEYTMMQARERIKSAYSVLTNTNFLEKNLDRQLVEARNLLWELIEQTNECICITEAGEGAV